MERTGFDKVREGVAAYLRESLPEEMYVACAPGSMDEGEIARVSVKSPALLVSVLEVIGVDRDTGRHAANLRFGVYLLTAPGKTGARPDDMALAILPRVLAVIDGENWCLPEVVSRPDKLKADNLYSGRLGNIGLLALWGISWEQYVILPEIPEEEEDDLAEFLRCELALTEADSGLQTDDVFNVRTRKPIPHDPPGGKAEL